MARLGDLIEQIRGVSYKPEDVYDKLGEDCIPLLRANNIKDGQLNFDDVLFVDKKRVHKDQLLKAGDVLICTSSGSKELVGKAAYVKEDLPMTFGAFCKVIRPQKIRSNYLGHFFNSPNYCQKISNSSTGANINNIRNENIDELEILLPTADRQEFVAEALDKLSDLISLRKQQLAKLDEVVKSRFIEMFIGKGYPTKTIDEVSLGKGEYGAQSASIKYVPARPRYVRITDINDDGTLNDDIVASIKPDDDEQYRLEYGDFLFARMGATVGKTYAFTTGKQIFAGYLIRYKLNQKLINPRYLFWYTKLDEYWNWVKLNQSGAAQPGINAKKYGSLRIPIPPIERQQQFVTFVEQTDKSKLTIQQSLDKLETLKKSLMQQYFG